MDRIVKLYSVNNKNSIQSINVKSPCWSCCWSKKNDNNFFIGLGNNKILSYDLRKTNHPLDIISNPKEMGVGKPVHSLMYISKPETQKFNSLDESYNGILGASLDKVFFCKKNHQPSLVDNTPSDTLSTTNNDANFSIGDRHSTSTTIVPTDSSSYKDDSLTDVASSPLDGKGDQSHDVYHQTVTQNPKFAATSNEKYSFLNWNENNGLIISLNYDVHSNQCIVTSRKNTLFEIA